MSIPDGYAILLEHDEDFDPATSVDWPEDEILAYVRRFTTGELAAYGVSIVTLNGDGNVICERYGDGSMGPVRIASLWGVEGPSDADGAYLTLGSLPTEYLRTIATELLPEVTS